MKKTLITSLIAIAVVAGLVFAASSVQPSVGLYWTSNADPTTGGGVAGAPLWQFLIRTDSPSLYYKSGTSATSWTRIGISSADNVGQFGDGSDGDVIIAANTTLTRDMFYRNLTVNAGATLTTAGYRVYVSQALVLNGAISNAGGFGVSGTTSSGGGAGAGAAGGALPPGLNGGAGSMNGCCSGGNNSSPCINGLGAAGCGGGNIGGNCGGGGGFCSNGGADKGGMRSITAATLGRNIYGLGINLFAGPGGGGGAGGFNCGGGGGGGGGGYVFVATKAWSGDGSLAAGGGNGGDGATGCTAGEGSSGGGGGAGGVIVFVSLGTSAPTENVQGGLGGTGNGVSPAFSNGRVGSNGFALNFISG